MTKSHQEEYYELVGRLIWRCAELEFVLRASIGLLRGMSRENAIAELPDNKDKYETVIRAWYTTPGLDKSAAEFETLVRRHENLLPLRHRVAHGYPIERHDGMHIVHWSRPRKGRPAELEFHRMDIGELSAAILELDRIQSAMTELFGAAEF